MERKVARAKGARTFDEQKALKEEISNLELQAKTIKDNFKMISTSVKRLEDDLRAVDRKAFIFSFILFFTFIYCFMHVYNT